MKYSEIMEAPIGTLDVSDMDQEGSFAAPDRRLLSNPAHLQKIRKHFDLNTFDFDLYFINRVGVKYSEPSPYEQEPGEIRRPVRATKDYYSDAETHTGTISPAMAMIFGVTNHNPDAITVIYFSNTNEENPIPMTPWMVAHRFAHVITDGTRLPEELTNLMQSERSRLPEGSSHPLLKQFGIEVPLVKMMTSRSARTGMLSSGELREEMISQYLTTRKGVTLALPAGIEIPDGVDPQAVQARVAQIASSCNVKIDKIMDACIGQIFISV